MGKVFFLVYIVEVLLEIIILVKLKKTKDSKYMNLFVGTVIGSIIAKIVSNPIYADGALGLGDAIFYWVVCGLSLISNIILFIVYLIIKKSIKKNKNKLNKTTFVTSILVIILNIAALILIPLLSFKITTKFRESYIINYLNNRYGNSNYEIVNVYKEYSSSGMWDKYLSGYHYELKCDYMDKTFMITTDDGFNYISSDYFIPVYYSIKNKLNYKLEYNDFSTSINYNFDEFNKYIIEIVKEQYSTSLDDMDVRKIYKDYIKGWNSIDGTTYSSNYNIIPENNGKIPTINELAEGLIKQAN